MAGHPRGIDAPSYGIEGRLTMRMVNIHIGKGGVGMHRRLITATGLSVVAAGTAAALLIGPSPKSEATTLTAVTVSVRPSANMYPYPVLSLA
jgi:hypothetical protein